MKVLFLPDALKQYVHWQDRDCATLAQLNRPIRACQRHPFEGTGKPEHLRGDYSGFWSRRIDREDRLVYRVEGETLVILQCRYHD